MNDRHTEGIFGGYGGIGLVCALFLAQMVLIKFSGFVPSHRFLFLFFFFNLILVPGYLLSRFFFLQIELPGRALLAFVFGTAAVFGVLVVLALFRLDLFYLGIVMPAVSVIFSIGLVRREPAAADAEGGRRRNSTVSMRDQIILLLLIVFACVLIISRGDPMLYTSDSAGQISQIRAVSGSHEVFPDRVLYREGGMLTRDIRKGLMHSAWGAINLMTGRKDVYAIWPLISLISSVFTILAIFCMGWFIFRSPPVGLIAAFVFVFIYGGGISSYVLITSAYSFPIGKTFSMVYLISFLCYLQDGRREWLVLMAAAAFAGTGTHIGHFLVCAFIIFYVAGGRFVEGTSQERKNLLAKILPAVAAITVGVNIPYLLMRYFRDYAPNNDIHTHLQGIFRISGALYTLNPVVFFKQAGIVLLLGLLSIFILWKRSRQDPSLRILLWGNIALWLLLFNPVLFPPVMKMIAYLVMRLRAAVPESLLVAVMIKALWDRARGKREMLSAKAAAAGWAVLIVCLGYQIVLAQRSFAFSRDPVRKSRSSCLNISDLYERIDSLAPAGSVIASDPITSYCIPAFTDQYVICTNSQHSVPNDSTALERIGECRKIFSPLSSMGDIAAVIKKYEVDYIAVNGRIPVETGTMFWKPDRSLALETVKRMEEYPSFFELLYKQDDAALFRITERFRAEEARPGDDTLTAEYIGDAVTAAELSGFPPSGTPGIHVKSLTIGSQSVARGDRLELDIAWVLDRECVYRSYLVHVRFDTEYDKGGMYRELYGKVYRKFLELKNGRRYRFRVDHLPFNGIFTPDMWPLFRVVRDSVIVRIPHDIAAGEYTISVRMSESTHYPNYSIKDLLSDEDSYDGPDVGKIIVR